MTPAPVFTVNELAPDLFQWQIVKIGEVVASGRADSYLGALGAAWAHPKAWWPT